MSRLVSYCKELVGKHVKINRGGPDSMEGTLIDVGSDYVTVYGDEGVSYVHLQHVKSVTEHHSGGSKGHKSFAVKLVRADNFHDLLHKLKHKFVKVNRHGPEKCEGFLADINDDTITLVQNHDIIKIAVYHVKAVSLKFGGRKSDGSKGGNKSGKNDKDGNKSGKHDKSDNKSGKSRSDKSDRSDSSGKYDKSGGYDSGKYDSRGKHDRSGKHHRSGKNGKSKKSDRHDKSGKHDKGRKKSRSGKKGYRG
ncbi:hypothetical protein ACFQWB_13600 [Paenibacillus thermoaerophilus]|uniref:Spore coat protein B n=1 Tax=Paenibacillus thermoaerophilus TaxID=1215385 RepID=A0ABW2V490_9BACL|nr:hypothetical protein [Paenibacillus thermoaerophilus]TMV16139.1 hypothetical protein FE781_08720 [Paenibacillus thermoaerophilus]